MRFIEIDHIEKNKIIRFKFDLSADNTSSIKVEVMKEIRNVMTGGIIFDLSKTSFIDSSGISLLLNIKKSIDAMGLKMVLTNVSRNFEVVLKATKLLDFFPRAKDNREGNEVLKNG